MSLTPGSRLGAYEVGSAIGAGGMGEVYRAVDTRLKRAVALKVLPEALRNDSDRLARFQREAEVLAAINHPNIAQIYGVEDAGGVTALVMELAEGPTLADLIGAAPTPRGLSVDEALPIARQVLDALDAAHDRGIVHRDLKPANIKVQPDGTVKVLDFGLAKAMDVPPFAGATGGNSATITSPALTAMGMILGTAAYMSPEQAKGRAVDRRADLWAFGCVLFEMLAGTRAFSGEDVTDTIANVLKSDANLGALPASVPTHVRQVIGTCLQKDPRQRLASAQDARLALDRAFETTAPAAHAGAPVRSTWQRAAPYAIGAVGAAIVVSLVVWRLAPTPEPAIVSRFDIDIPEGQELRNLGRPVIAMSPDGRSLVYNAAGGLRVRGIGDLEARIVPGTEAAAVNPFYSPDGQFVAFWASGQIRRVALGGGAAEVIAKDVDSPLGAHWAEDGTILLALRDGIARVSDTGGTPEMVVKSDPSERLAMPQLLPGGDSVLFTMVALDPIQVSWDRAQIGVHSLRTGQRTVVLQGGRDARYLPTGHLAYVVENTLFAVGFDLKRLAVLGSPKPLVQKIWWRGETTVVGNWAVSNGGTLAYLPDLPTDSLRPVWVQRDGAVGRIDNLPGGTDPRLATDGRRALFEVDRDIWIYDLATGRRSRVTSGGVSSRPAWHPDGTQVAYSSGGDIWIAPADGNGAPRRLTEDQRTGHVDAWSPDGRTLAFHRHPPGDAPNEILTISPADPKPQPQPLVRRAFASENAVFSPDGRYVAYISSEAGGREIYIQQVPGPGPQVPVSVGGGREPIWARNGELFYRSRDGDRMMVVKVTTSPSLVVGTPKQLFQGTFFVVPRTGSPRPQYDVTADGQRLLMLQVDRSARPQIIVVQNWFEETRRVLSPK